MSADCARYTPHNSRYGAKRDQSLAQFLNEDEQLQQSALDRERLFTNTLSVENDSRFR